MKISRIFFFMLSLAFFTACNNTKTARAKIFERKEVDNKLMIKYSFIVDGKAVSDSAIIDNRALQGDSISVNYDPSNPSENSPELVK